MHHCNVVYHRVAGTSKAVANHRSNVAELQVSEVVLKVDFRDFRVFELNWLGSSSALGGYCSIADFSHLVDKALDIWIRTGTKMPGRRNSQNHHLAQGLH